MKKYIVIFIIVFFGCNDQKLKWFSGSLEEAFLNQDNKIIMVDFYTDWCIPCKQIDSETLTIAGGTDITTAVSGDTVTFSETTSVLSNASQANCTLNSSTGVITTTDFGGSSTTPTTYTFTIRITDAENQTADREFSLTSSFGATGSGGFN